MCSKMLRSSFVGEWYTPLYVYVSLISGKSIFHDSLWIKTSFHEKLFSGLRCKFKEKRIISSQGLEIGDKCNISVIICFRDDRDNHKF